MSNIHGLGSVDKNKDEMKGHEAFSQSGKVSGTSVYRPTDGPGRLTDDVIQAAKSNAAAEIPEANVGKITMYANGFTINDGEFQDASDPQNQGFMEDLKNGIVPKQIEEDVRRIVGIRKQNVGVSLVNKTHERFEPPPPKFDFAKSQGQSLGSSMKPAVAFTDAVPEEVKVDEGKPTTTVQLVLHNRTRMRQKFNLDHTVFDIYKHLMSVSGLNAPFSMMAGFPPKQLTDPNATIEAAGLKGASVSMRV